MKVYVAGPMRGLPLYNFPAFDAAAERLRAQGHTVINPADLDREVGVNEHTDPLPANFLREAMSRDLPAICDCDAIALLPGWHTSSGTSVELALAKLLKLVVLDAITGEVFAETALDEAKRLCYGERNNDYGHPLDDFTRTAAIWSAILGAAVSAEQVALCMVGVKISRECNHPKRDNPVDIAGYADCLQRVKDERQRRSQRSPACAARRVKVA